MPVPRIEADAIRAQVLELAAALEALAGRRTSDRYEDEARLRQLAVAAVEVEFSVRHRATIDPALVAGACREALVLLEERRPGPADLLHARARAACRVLLRALTDVNGPR